MKDFEPPIPHQTLHGSKKRLRRYYYVCGCGFVRGRNSRFKCSCGREAASYAKRARKK